MSFKLNKVVTLTFGALVMIMVGAAGMCAVNNVIPAYLTVKPAVPTTNTTPVKSPAKVQATTPSIAQAPTQKIVSISNPSISQANSNYVLAQIIDVKPRFVTKTVPYRSCKQVPRTYVSHQQRAVNGSGVVLGGVAGGLIGNQFGKGRGKVATTIGGTIVGAAIGNQMEREMNRPRYRTYYTTVCKTRYKQKTILKGYDVIYQYNNQQGVKFMKHKPQGDLIRLEVA